MEHAEHILVVDDEPGICKLLDRYLSQQGYRVSTAGDGVSMLKVLEADIADLVILDLILPGEDGLSLTRRLQEDFGIPVIILTQKSDMVDRVVGLEMGADDYVAKPFNVRELHARVKSVLRRVNKNASDGVPPKGGAQAQAGDIVFIFEGWRLDTAKRELTDPSGDDVPLTKGEFDLLSVFLSNPNRLLDRDTLMSRVHGREWTPFDRGIDVQIGRLRRKLGGNIDQREFIRTVRGAGYMFIPNVETGSQN